MQHVDFLVAQMVRYATQNGLLDHYSEDLTKHDRRMFETMNGWQAFAWVVGKTSSDVYPLGLHERFNRDIQSVASVRVPSGAHCLWVNAERAKGEGGDVLVPVTHEGFERGIRNTKCYTFDRGHILTPSGAKAASLTIDAMHCALSGTTTCLYDLHPLLPSFLPAWGEQFALSECIKRHGLWVRLYERQAWFASQKKAA